MEETYLDEGKYFLNFMELFTPSEKQSFLTQTPALAASKRLCAHKGIDEHYCVGSSQDNSNLSRILMRLFLFAVVLASLSASPALAQEAAGSKALQLRVRPSGFEPEPSEAQRRQERLLKRMEQSNHMVRSICVNCGDSWKHQIYAPFNPYASLAPSARPSEAVED